MWRGLAVAAAAAAALSGGSAQRPYTCLNPAVSGFPMCNVRLSVQERVADLMSRLSQLNETYKFGQLNSWDGSFHVPQLAIPGYQWWNEALHGLGHSPGVHFHGKTPGATMFPEPSFTGCSFNTSLYRAIGMAIADDARGFNNNGNAGLTYWSPDVNPFRDPRWGRGQEVAGGEDPFAVSQYAREFVRGMQEGADPRYLKVSACCKHLVAYDLEGWNNTGRDSYNAVVTDADLADYYLPSFQTCVQSANVSGLMCSYNALNGVPTCASSFLLTDIARKEWGFSGYITSDCEACDDVQNSHHYTNSTDATCVVLTQSGMDTCCSDYLPPNLANAVAHGAVNMADIDRMLSNLLTVKMRLGFFDDPSRQPYAQIGTEQICSKQLLSLEAAQQSIVLLKNADVLPLRATTIKSVAVVGPNGDNPTVQQGNYEGDPCFSKAWNEPLIYTIRQGLQAYMTATSESSVETDAPASCNGHFNTTVCGCHVDGANIDLACPPSGEVVAVQFASLGTPQGVCGALRTGSCAANSSVVMRAVSKQCVGKNSCTVEADIEHMSAGTDPCPGVVKSVAVQLECSKAFAPPPPPAPPPAIRFVQGCDDGVPCTKTTGFANASAAAAVADLTVVVVGLDQSQEKEGNDRVGLELPGKQSLLVEQTCAAAKGPCVLVVMTGGPVDISTELVNPRVSSVLFVGYPGPFGGNVTAQALFGDVAPAGRLTTTIYPASFVNAVSFFDQNLPPGPSVYPPYHSPGRTHMHYTGQAVLPFGWGLSFTSWTYVIDTIAVWNNVSRPCREQRCIVPLEPVNQYLAANPNHGAMFAPLVWREGVSYCINVTNTGSVDSDDVVLGFLVPPQAGQMGVPLQVLFGFSRIHVKASDTEQVCFGIEARFFTQVIRGSSKRSAMPGNYKVRFGVKFNDSGTTKIPSAIAEHAFMLLE